MKLHIAIISMLFLCLMSTSAFAEVVVNTLPTPDSGWSFNQLIGGIYQPLRAGILANITLDNGVTGSTCYIYYGGNNSLIKSVNVVNSTCIFNISWSTLYNYTIAVGTPSTSSHHRYRDAQVSLPISYQSVKHLCKASSTDNGVTWDHVACGLAYHYNIVSIVTTHENWTAITTLPTLDASFSVNQLIGGVFQPTESSILANFTVDSNVTGASCYMYYTTNNSLIATVPREGINCVFNRFWSNQYNYTLAVGTPGSVSVHRYRSNITELPLQYEAIKYWCKIHSSNSGQTWNSSCSSSNLYNIVTITTLSELPNVILDNITVTSLPIPDNSFDASELSGGIFQPLINSTLKNFTVESGVTGTTCYMYYTANSSLITSVARNGTNCAINRNWSTQYNYTLAVGTPNASSTHRYKVDQVSVPIEYSRLKYWCKTASDDNGVSWAFNNCVNPYHYNIVAITTDIS